MSSLAATSRIHTKGKKSGSIWEFELPLIFSEIENLVGQLSTLYDPYELKEWGALDVLS